MDGRKEIYKKFLELLKKNGFVALGHGAFGLVFEKPGYPWVIKIFKWDKAYLEWINVCEKLQHNLFVPKIKRKPITISKNISMIQMEKLTKYKDTDIEYPNLNKFFKNPNSKTFYMLMPRDFRTKMASNHKKKMMQNLSDQFDSGKIDAKTFEKQREKYDYYYYFGDYLDDNLTTFELLPKVKQFRLKYHKNLMEIAKHLKTTSYTLDIHDANVMMRGDQLVITDPLADMNYIQ